MGSELDLDDVAAQNPLAQRQLKALRDGLALARDWLQGWASAEPYIARIDALLKQAPTPQAPIAKVTVWRNLPPNVQIYAPGLPPGDHELYCEPEAVAPYLRDNSRADT
jgi:hypothetical protein